MRWFVLSLALFYFVLVFFSPFSIAITLHGEERANLGHTFVRFALVWFCVFPLPLYVWEGLQLVIVALPGLFSYFFFFILSGYKVSLYSLYRGVPYWKLIQINEQTLNCRLLFMAILIRKVWKTVKYYYFHAAEQFTKTSRKPTLRNKQATTSENVCAQPRFMQSDQNRHWLHAFLISKDKKFFNVDKEDSGQTVWMHRLLCIFVGCTGMFS